MPVNIRDFINNFGEFLNTTNYVIDNLRVLRHNQNGKIAKETMNYIIAKIYEAKWSIFFSKKFDYVEKKINKRISINDIDLAVFTDSELKAIIDLKYAPQSEYIEISRKQVEDFLNFQEKTDADMYYLSRLPGGFYNLLKVNLLAEQVKQGFNKDIQISMKQGITFDKRKLTEKLTEIVL